MRVGLGLSKEREYRSYSSGDVDDLGLNVAVIRLEPQAADPFPETMMTATSTTDKEPQCAEAVPGDCYMPLGSSSIFPVEPKILQNETGPCTSSLHESQCTLCGDIHMDEKGGLQSVGLPSAWEHWQKSSLCEHKVLCCE